MKNILMFIKRLLLKHKDKVYHFFCSYTAMLAFTTVAIIKFDASVRWSVNFGIAMAVLIGVVKEFYDLYAKKSRFSIGDLLTDISIGDSLAGTLGIILAVILVA